MFICLNCGEIFEEPKHYVEKHGFEYGPFEEYDGCPVCGDSYEEAYECSNCNSYICETNAVIMDGREVCEACADEIAEELCGK